LIVGGSQPEGEAFDRGFFFNPTVIDGAGDSALVMTQESYRPIAAVRKVRDDGEALKIANTLPYDLAAYVYTQDLERAWAFAEKLESGSVGVNVNDTSALQAPFGGWKLSGMGRERGVEGLMVPRAKAHQHPTAGRQIELSGLLRGGASASGVTSTGPRRR
jgi:succinate-semialdehyde dehydrogenase / glutarate-semialdehyde dehydrogenase